MENAKQALWLIDAAYLMKARHSVGSSFDFDYSKLRAHLVRHCAAFWKICLLNSRREEIADAEMNFYRWLEKRPPEGPGFEVHLFPLKRAAIDEIYCEQCGAKVHVACPKNDRHILSTEVQKAVDVALATFAVTEIPHYDCLVLSSGDGDLLPAVEAVKTAGKQFKLVVFKRGVSRELQDKADQILWIDDFAGQVARGGR